MVEGTAKVRVFGEAGEQCGAKPQGELHRDPEKASFLLKTKNS